MSPPARPLAALSGLSFRGGASSFDAGEALSTARGARLDEVGVAQLLTLGHLMGSRALVKGASRSMPPGSYAAHGRDAISDFDTWAADLESALLRELSGYLEGKRSALLLLSGGLDSRILAGLVKRLQEDGRSRQSVLAATWGVEQSRDVQYARRIAQIYGWEWRHEIMSADVLAENLDTVLSIGAEVAAHHLHAMPRLTRDLRGQIDVVLAASYGNSVAQGDYSGRGLMALKPLWDDRWRRLGLFKSSFRSAVEADIHADAADFGGSPASSDVPWSRHELEQQHHCKRRMLSGAMSVLEALAPVRQLFTSPDVYGRIWRLDAHERDDRLYRFLLPRLPGRIHEIPWAWTGRPFGAPGPPLDGFSSDHHDYGGWLRKNLAPAIRREILEGPGSRLSCFVPGQIERLLNVWSRARTRTVSLLDEMVSNLYALSKLMRRLELRMEDDFPSSPSDALHSRFGGAFQLVRINARNLFRA
ncbi:MAG: asparagine synthase-related protein [Vicinamibacteraceae bacterium]